MAQSIQCVMVTPERIVLDEAVDFVAAPLYDGEIGVLKGRAPFIGRLGYGELRTRKGDQTERFFVDGGFIQVRSNVVTLLTPRAVRASDIRPTVLNDALEAARQPAGSPEGRTSQQQTIAKARVQARIASRESGGRHSS